MKYLLQFILLSICLLVSYSCLAQTEESPPPKELDKLFGGYAYPKMDLKFSPFSLMPLPLSSFQFAFEHRLKKPQHAFEHELGILMPYPYNANDNNTAFHRLAGFRWRTGYRYYFNEPSSGTNWFISPKYHFQYEIWNVSSWFERDGGAFQQFYKYDKQVISHGYLGTIGFNLRGKNNPITFELSTSIGAKSRKVINKDIPDDARPFANDFFFIPLASQFNPIDSEITETTILPVMHFSLKVGVVLK